MNDARLSELNFKTPPKKIGKFYTRFIKSMRLFLPLAALGLVVVVMAWPQMDNKIATIEASNETLIPDTALVENELIKPRFESLDSNENPYVVTASKATQNQQKPDLVMLDDLKANVILKDGATLDVEALSGSYEQKEEKLFLETDVVLTHGQGYELKTNDLRIDLKQGAALSDRDVQITGAQFRINAAGMNGQLNDEVLIFNGPATVILNQNGSDNE